MSQKEKKFPFFTFAILIVLIITFSIGFIISLAQTQSSSQGINFTQTPEENLIYRQLVHISGAVSNPGVYEFPEDTRVAEIIEKAGGLKEDADKEFISKNINLAQKVKDEQKIFIPYMSLAAGISDTNISESVTGLININSASPSELDALPGIGPATAQKIIDARPFESVEELLDVSGIGDTKFNDIAALVTI
jgi:competence protein ComEA